MSVRVPKRLDKESLVHLMRSIDACLFDADGVLWHDESPIQGAVEAVRCFHVAGKSIAITTNNSSKSCATYVDKCKRLGFEMFKQENIVSTSSVLADYLQKGGFQDLVYVLGSEGIGHELDKVGIKHFGIGEDNTSLSDLNLHFKPDPQVGAVVMGFDAHINYAKISKACAYLANADCLFLATNVDETFPVKTSCGFTQRPGTGSMVASVQRASGRNPTVMGKPNQPMFEYAANKMNITDPKRILMVGDRLVHSGVPVRGASEGFLIWENIVSLNTDIAFGRKQGMYTLAVLTGVTQLQDLNATDIDQEQSPDYFIDSLGDIVQMLSGD